MFRELQTRAAYSREVTTCATGFWGQIGSWGFVCPSSPDTRQGRAFPWTLLLPFHAKCRLLLIKNVQTPQKHLISRSLT